MTHLSRRLSRLEGQAGPQSLHVLFAADGLPLRALWARQKPEAPFPAHGRFLVVHFGPPPVGQPPEQAEAAHEQD
jgi:hypothetical protein